MTCFQCGTGLIVTLASPTQVILSRVLGAVLGLSPVFLVVYIAWVAWRPVYFDGISIHGTAEFKSNIASALHLLKSKAPESYAVVTNYIGAFVESKHSGIAAYEKPPTSYLRDKVPWVSIEAFAGDIAHESLHSKLYHEYLKKTPVWDTTPWDGAVSPLYRKMSGEARQSKNCAANIKHRS